MCGMFAHVSSLFWAVKVADSMKINEVESEWLDTKTGYVKGID